MGIIRRYLRLHWDANEGWILDVPFPLTRKMLEHVAKWAFKVQLDRWRALPHGDRRDELGRALHLLKEGKIKQRIIDDDNDGVFVLYRHDLPYRR